MSGFYNAGQNPLRVVLVDPTTLNDYAGAASTSGSATNPTYTSQANLTAATDRSGTANTTSGQIVAANTSRRGLEIQNVGANNIGINEFAGTAVIGNPGTYTLVPGASMRVRTNRAITAIAATAATAFTATEW